MMTATATTALPVATATGALRNASRNRSLAGNIDRWAPTEMIATEALIRQWAFSDEFGTDVDDDEKL